MYSSSYTDSLHQRLDFATHDAATLGYASSSTTRSSFSAQQPPQQDVSIQPSNPWGAPDMFATDPKLAAFYGDAAAAVAAANAAGLGTGVDGLIHESYDYTDDPNLLGELDMDAAAAVGLHQFSPEDLEAIIASGILDNNTLPATPAVNILHPRASQAQVYYPTAPQIQYDDTYIYQQLSQQDRMPSMASVMGIHSPSPPFFPSSVPSPQNYDVVRGDSNIIVNSPMPADDGLISVSSPQTSYEPPEAQTQPQLEGQAAESTSMDTSVEQNQPATPTGQVAAKAATNRYSLVDFAFHHTLGTGSFGRVHLVQSKHNMRFYAIKVLAKEKVVRLKQVEHTNSERGLLGLCKHPFLVNLWGTFQDQHNLFMVMDFVAGGELFTLIRKSVRFPATVAKFYAAEVATALEYLHQIDIIYRDLKPENILIGQDGHVKLTDFGFAKRVRSSEQTYTMCGTPDYLAPEIILSQGYTQSVDWYAWGVLIFEMLAGHPPFYTKNSDPSQLYRKIIEGHVRYPAQMDPLARDLIANCLSSDLSKRYGNTLRGSIEIFRHSWFAEVNWEMLVRKEIPAPYVPALNGDGDSSQFEAYAENDPQREYGMEGPDPFADFFVDFC